MVRKWHCYQCHFTNADIEAWGGEVPFPAAHIQVSGLIPESVLEVIMKFKSSCLEKHRRDTHETVISGYI